MLHGTNVGPRHTARTPFLRTPVRPNALERPVTDLEDTTSDASGPSRRRIAQAAGWSVPLVVAAVGAPAAQASTPSAEPFDGLTGTWSTPVRQADRIGTATFTLINTSSTVLPLNNLLFLPTDPNGGIYIMLGTSSNWSTRRNSSVSDDVTSAAHVRGRGLFQPGQGIQVNCYINFPGALVNSTTVVSVTPDGYTDTPVSFASVTFDPINY